MFEVNWLLRVVSCLMFAVCGLWFVGRCSSSGVCFIFVRCLLFVACCSLRVVRCWLFVVRCLLCVVCCLLFGVCYLLCGVI